ncbi:junction-mediating and -regulatory protein-like X2 [Biomphalaria pfeifferi]|uniref:Junction-mediating and -regulatory protein-like X2 n=1 Tax=Biomphalaria pfeifferi TaxID=112525 RepID=A0AAD8B8P0_BIOPF|nr:junction-mediating and -regulatory protein-like X2 [Biomphalaria pfeifferi]
MSKDKQKKFIPVCDGAPKTQIPPPELEEYVRPPCVANLPPCPMKKKSRPPTPVPEPDMPVHPCPPSLKCPNPCSQ